MSLPYDYAEARDAVVRAHTLQKEAEDEIRDAARGYGKAEEEYRTALAKKILELRAAGQPVTIVQDLARGDEHVAQLRFLRDVEAGKYEAAKQRMWRHTADRRELEQLIDWSRRVAPDGQIDERRLP